MNTSTLTDTDVNSADVLAGKVTKLDKNLNEEDTHKVCDMLSAALQQKLQNLNADNKKDFFKAQSNFLNFAWNSFGVNGLIAAIKISLQEYNIPLHRAHIKNYDKMHLEIAAALEIGQEESADKRALLFSLVKAKLSQVKFNNYLS